MTVPTIRVDELQRWTLLLDHLAHWLSRADGVTCDHYQGFAATSCSYRDSDLLDMVFALTGIICRLDEVVEGAGVITTATPTSMVVTLQAHEAKEIVWVLEVIAQWLESHATDVTWAGLARFLDYPGARGAVLHVIDTAARWAGELQRRNTDGSSRAAGTSPTRA